MQGLIEFHGGSTSVGLSASAGLGEDAQNTVELLMQLRGRIRRHIADIPQPEWVGKEFGRVVLVDRDSVVVLCLRVTAGRGLG